MHDGGWCPASEIFIKSLITLQIQRHPQSRKMFAAAYDSFWRIDPVALKVKSHGAVYLHHRRRGFFARKGSGFGGARRPVAVTRLQGPASQARSLSQSRPRNDVGVAAPRRIRDR